MAAPPPDRVEDIPSAPAGFDLGEDSPWRVRADLTFGLLWLVVLTIAFIALQVLRGYWEGEREFTEVILPMEAALLGSAIAFYFSNR